MTAPPAVIAPVSRFRRAIGWAAERQLLLLAVLAPWLLLPEWFPIPAVIALAAVPVLWATRWVARGQPVVRTPADWPLVGLLAMVLVGVWAAPDKGLVAPKLCSIVLGVAAYYAIAESATSAPRSRAIAGGLALACFAVALAGLVGTDWLGNKIVQLQGLYSWLPRLVQQVPRSARGGFHPNPVGGALGCLIPVAAGLLFSARHGREGRPRDLWGWADRVLGSPAFLAVSLTAGAVVLLLTQSRAAIGSTVAALLFYALLRTRWALVPIAALVVGSIGLLASLGPQRVVGWLAPTPQAQTLATRFSVWGAGLDAARDYPFTGLGLANFEPVVRYRYALPGIPEIWPMTHAHNILLQMAADVGVFGLLCFAAILVVGAVAGMRALRRQRGGPAYSILAGALAGLLGYLLWNQTDAFPLGNKPGTVVWLLLGLVVANSVSGSAARPPRRSKSTKRALLVSGACAAGVLVLLGSLGGRPIAGRLLANLGRVEGNLALLPPDTTGDTATPHLQRALADLESSLAVDPDQPRVAGESIQVRRDLADIETAIRRLGLRCDSYGVDWLSASAPLTMHVASAADVAVTAANCGLITWRAEGTGRTLLLHYWLNARGQVARWDGTHVPLPRDILPGEEVALIARVLAPEQPGRYTLRLDFMLEHESWFANLGCTPLDLSVEVLPTH